MRPALLLAALALAPVLAPAAPLRTLFICGDSTAADNHSAQAVGWGIPFAQFFDPSKIEIANRSRGGRSSRTYITEGLWDKVLAEIKPGDIVLIQFGHNDSSPINDASRARGSIRSLGEETQAIDNLLTHKPEIVHTFGWYMRKMISEAKARGAIPIVMGTTVRNVWHQGVVERGPADYRDLAAQVAGEENVRYLDITDLIADHYQAMGPAAVAPFFPRDHTHTDIRGATFTAGLVASALSAIKDLNLADTLSAAGKALPPAPLAADVPAKAVKG